MVIADRFSYSAEALVSGGWVGAPVLDEKYALLDHRCALLVRAAYNPLVEICLLNDRVSGHSVFRVRLLALTLPFVPLYDAAMLAHFTCRK